MPDPTALSAEELVLAYGVAVADATLVMARQGVPWQPERLDALRAELLRRLREWDGLACGPVDPPGSPSPS
jgi:hypothetical protein